MDADGSNVEQITVTSVARLQRFSELGQMVSKQHPAVTITPPLEQS